MRLELFGQKPRAVEGLANMYVAGRHWAPAVVTGQSGVRRHNMECPLEPFFSQTTLYGTDKVKGAG